MYIDSETCAPPDIKFQDCAKSSRASVPMHSMAMIAVNKTTPPPFKSLSGGVAADPAFLPASQERYHHGRHLPRRHGVRALDGV